MQAAEQPVPVVGGPRGSPKGTLLDSTPILACFLNNGMWEKAGKFSHVGVPAIRRALPARKIYVIVVPQSVGESIVFNEYAINNLAPTFLGPEGRDTRVVAAGLVEYYNPNRARVEIKRLGPARFLVVGGVTDWVSSNWFSYQASPAGTAVALLGFDPHRDKVIPLL